MNKRKFDSTLLLPESLNGLFIHVFRFYLFPDPLNKYQYSFRLFLKLKHNTGFVNDPWGIQTTAELFTVSATMMHPVRGLYSMFSKLFNIHQFSLEGSPSSHVQPNKPTAQNFSDPYQHRCT